jgi:hypothetical protein
MDEDKCTEGEYVQRYFYSPLSSMQFVAMLTPTDMNGLVACAIHYANPIVT